MKRSMRIVCVSVAMALSPLAAAQTAGDVDALATSLDATAASRGQTLVAGKIASNFTALAGSEKNALALVNALRNGTNATLTYPAAPSTTGTPPPSTAGTPPPVTTGTPPPVTTTYDPPTGKMGWGNVKIALALAQASLASVGITKPTAAQLQAALNGGDVTVKNADGTTTTTTLKGVLQMRASGMGWGQIAQAGGTKLGPVVSGLKMAHSKIAALPTTTATTSGTSVAGPKASLSAKGITTATGAGVSASPGKDGARGIVTASGGSAGSPHGNAYGRGIVTATGSASPVGAATHGPGQGVVTATGGGAGSVTTAQGNAGNHGKPEGKGKSGG